MLQNRTVSDPTYISFSQQDLELFSDASGDRNPLHLSEQYSRSTPYGQPVVFGCLGALACLRGIDLPSDRQVMSLDVSFLKPMFVNVPYRIETLKKEDRWEARLLDGSLPVISVSVVTTPKIFATNQVHSDYTDAPLFERSAAALRTYESIVPGLTISGKYRVDLSAVDKLIAKWGVENRALGEILLWSSYLVGMELPGETALFSKIVLKFTGPVCRSKTMSYRASVASVDRRFDLLKTEVSITSAGSEVATGQFLSYIRSPIDLPHESEPSEVNDSVLAGQICVIVGSSRGLGAAMMKALEARGAHVFGLARSAGPHNLDKIEIGSASDPNALRRLKERVFQKHGRLDLLICNAFPAVMPVRMEPDTSARIADYINQAVSFTLAPLCEFLELLNQSEGRIVLISSAAVEKPVREWPHYIAAKCAVEGLASVASMQYPLVSTLIVRPPKLLTALTNTPMGRLGALSPRLFADRIAVRLEGPTEKGKTEIADLTQN